MKLLIIIIGLILTENTFSLTMDKISPIPADTINFFFDANLVPMVGLSCSSDLECKNKCQNTEACQKPISTCLDCIGSKSPYLSDFFNNIGETTSTCLDQNAVTFLAKDFFKSVDMISIFSDSSYNPFDLKDRNIAVKFGSLCPAGTHTQPVAIAFINPVTHAVEDIPLLKCDDFLLPLVREGENCDAKTKKIIRYMTDSSLSQNMKESTFKKAVDEGSALPIKYQVIQFSEFTEAQFIGCSDSSQPICQNICNSSLSCTIPLKNEVTAKGITAFNEGIYTDCGTESFSIEILTNYLNSDRGGFSFNASSLMQTYQLPKSNSDFKDLTVLNSILGKYANIFQAAQGTSEEGSFFISDENQLQLQEKMQAFCDSNSVPYILGHNQNIERVFCSTGQNGYFKILAAHGESCSDKTRKLSFSKNGSQR